MKILITILSASLLLAACGGDNSRIVQYRVGSYPGVHLEIPVYPVVFVPSLNDSDDYTVKSHPCNQISGFDPDWGTRYDITVRVSKRAEAPIFTDNQCGEENMELISIDNMIQDPIGTRYYIDATSTDFRGLRIIRGDSGAFFLDQYTEPFYCAAEVCDEFLGSSNSKPLTAEYAFELMEIDGERVIGLIEL